MPRKSSQQRVLFVCLGNICRSPLIEAVFKHRIAQLGIAQDFAAVDSCGTAAYHVGDDPDERSAETCAKHGVPIKHKGRQLTAEDFDAFDYIFGMDKSNIENIERKRPKGSTVPVTLFGKHDPKGELIIEDPYYGGQEGFETVFRQAVRATDGFLRSLGYTI